MPTNIKHLMGSSVTSIIILIFSMMLVFITVATVRFNLEPVKLSNIGYENQRLLNNIVSEQKKMKSLIEDLDAKIDKLNLK